MERQLVLLEGSSTDWRLDDRTREMGREGVKQAREALRQALQHERQTAA